MRHIIGCHDCRAILAVRSTGLSRALDGSGWDNDWFMVKDSVWRSSQRGGKCRFLCVGCLEHRIGRKLAADDFSRSAKVNFVGEKSAKLRRRMRGLNASTAIR